MSDASIATTVSETPAVRKVMTETWSGRVVDLCNLHYSDVDPMDLAVHLSRINRFNGGTTRPWSVAEHSIAVADECEKRASDRDKLQARLYGLLHDAHEAYIGDLTRTLQRLLSAEANQQIEKIKANIDVAILTRFSLPYGFPERFCKTLQAVDDCVAKTEALELLPGGGACWEWFQVAPLQTRITMMPLSKEEAAAKWLRDVTLTSERVKLEK